MSAPLFQPFRALGYITDSVPFSVQRLGRESFVTVSVGKSWQVNDAFTLSISLYLSVSHIPHCGYLAEVQTATVTHSAALLHRSTTAHSCG